jgi:hypothetical protein
MLNEAIVASKASELGELAVAHEAVNVWLDKLIVSIELPLLLPLVLSVELPLLLPFSLTK